MINDTDLNGNNRYSRLVNFETGEVLVGDPFELLAATAHRAHVFEEHRAQRRGEGLVERHISHRSSQSSSSGLRFTVNVHEDIVIIAKSDGRTGEQVGGGRRGEVRGFSRQSRLRMLTAMAQARDLMWGHFLTLTFPDSVVEAFGSVNEWGSYAKRSLDVFLKRVARKFPEAAGWWRMELMPRKSGVFAGEVVPHFHLLLFNVAPDFHIQALRTWLSRVWYEVVGSSDVKHLKAGTNVRVISSRRHMQNYASKYAAKSVDDDYAVGRRWGEFGEINKAAFVSVAVSSDDMKLLKRLLRNWLKSRGSRRFARSRSLNNSAAGCSLFGLGQNSIIFNFDFGPTILRMLAAVAAAP